MRQPLPKEKAARGRGGSSFSGQALRPSQARQRGRTGLLATRKPQEKLLIGLNFGSSALSAALTIGNREAEIIPLGMINGPRGKIMEADKLPTSTMFLEPGKFETLGHDSVADFSRTSSGAKQSLDSRLCQPGSEGAMFVELCERYEVRKEDVITKLFADVLVHIKRYLKKKYGEVTLSKTFWTTTIATVGVPTFWTGGPIGTAIQTVLMRCIVEAGYPDVPWRVRCDGEEELTCAYIRHTRKINAQQQVRTNGQELFIDAGASTTDFAPRVSWHKHTVLAGEPVGCGGGMANFWRWLYGECYKRNQDLTYFEAAQAFVFGLDRITGDEDFVRDSHTIRVADIKSKIVECFQDPISLARDLISKMSHIREVIVSGEAPTSNTFIRSMWETAIKDAFARLHRPECLITFVDSDDASLAVCKGAAMPYDEDPRKRFKNWCFGFKCHDCQLKGKCPDEKKCENGKSYINELKARRSTKIADWVPISTDDLEKSVLVIEPHMVIAGKPWRSLVSKDTQNQTWPTNCAVSMDPITVILQPCPDPGTKLEMRFRADEKSSIEPPGEFSLEDPPRIIFEVCVSIGGERNILASVTLGLYADRARLFFVELARREGKEVFQAGRSTLSVEKNFYENGSLEQSRGSSVQEIGETPPPPADSASPATAVKTKRHGSTTRNERKRPRIASVDLGPASVGLAVDPTLNENDGEDPETEPSIQSELLDSERTEDSAGASTSSLFWNVVGTLRPKDIANAKFVRGS